MAGLIIHFGAEIVPDDQSSDDDLDYDHDVILIRIFTT